MIRSPHFLSNAVFQNAGGRRIGSAIKSTLRCSIPARKTGISLQSYHTTSSPLLHPSDDNDTASTRTSWSDLLERNSTGDRDSVERPSWSEEWKRLGLGAKLVETTGGSEDGYFPKNLFFVQLGFGVDQHGDTHSDGFATKAAVRAVRNAIEFNSIPGVIDHLPGGRHEMLIHVKIGVPLGTTNNIQAIDALEVAMVFPYGRLLPIEVVRGGLEFHSGRVVEELGDQDDVGICCVACVSIGYNGNHHDTTVGGHKTYNTKDGY